MPQETVVQMLEISTGHISLETKNWIEQSREAAALIIYEKGLYGWIILIPQEKADNGDWFNSIPESLRTVIEFAKTSNCKWVMLDCDGPFIPELPQYEW